jgi:hypothetical protein
MKPSFFEQSLLLDEPPEIFSVYLKALWYERKGRWDKAHSLVDHLEEKEAARIHAYLHRKEGDSSNAMYWYQRAGTAWPSLDTDGEWEELVRQFSKPD